MSKTVLVTGANRGIGLAFVKYYHSIGFKVIATARNPNTPELMSLPIRKIKLDVSSESSINEAANELKDIPIDLLINNAGIFCLDNLASVSASNVLQQFTVNALGVLILTKAFLPHLQKTAANGGTKVINITSRLGSIGDNTSGAYYGYRASKAALNAISKSLAHDLKDTGIAVLAIHPGLIQTDMTGGRGDMGPKEAVDCMAVTIEKFNIGHTGEFWHRDGYVLPW